MKREIRNGFPCYYRNEGCDIIKSDLGINKLYFVPVCAWDIVYTVYSDEDCNNQIAYILYDKD